MKFAIFSDIHGNIYALEACIKYIEKIHVDAIIWCGDYITDIPRSHEVIQYIKKINNKYPHYMIRGNREEYIIEYHMSKNKQWTMKDRKGPLLCSYNELELEDIHFIKNLPEECTIDIAGIPKIYVSHKRNYNSGSDCKYKIFGHSHKQYLFSRDTIRYINPGSVGLATDGQTGAEFTILEVNNHETNIQNYSIPYDRNKAIEDIRNSKLKNTAVKWGAGLIKLIQTGIDYPDMYLKEILKIAKEYGLDEDLDTVPIEVWEEARKSLELND